MPVKSRVTQSNSIEETKTARVASSDSDLVRDEIEYRASDHDAVVMVAMILYHRPVQGTDNERATVRGASLSRRYGLTIRAMMNPVDLNPIQTSALHKSGAEARHGVVWERLHRELLCLVVGWEVPGGTCLVMKSRFPIPPDPTTPFRH